MYRFTGIHDGTGRGSGSTRGRDGKSTRRPARGGRVWLAAMLLGLLALAMQVGTVAANQPLTLYCIDWQCISNVQVTPHGQYANIAFHTNLAGIAIVQVAQVAPNKLPDGTLSYTNIGTDSFATTNIGTDSFATTPAVTDHKVELPNLKANTSYYFLITAEKGSTGKDAQYQGTFKTLKRYVKATISEINLLDDTEWNGAGDVVFNLYADFTGPDFFPSGGTTKWNSNETKTVNMSVTTVAGNSVTVKLRAWEWDDDQQGWLPGYPITIGSYNTAGLDGDNAFASKTFNVEGNGHDEAFTQNFSLETTGQDLKFKAYGHIDVWYAA